jgi:hypothetical protein
LWQAKQKLLQNIVSLKQKGIYNMLVAEHAHFKEYMPCSDGRMAFLKTDLCDMEQKHGVYFHVQSYIFYFAT